MGLHWDEKTTKSRGELRNIGTSGSSKVGRSKKKKTEMLQVKKQLLGKTGEQKNNRSTKSVLGQIPEN